MSNTAGTQVTRQQGVAASNGIELWYETFGEASQPAILLIMGAGIPARYWPDELCGRLAETGRFVIRFDNRDSGRSTWFKESSASPRELVRLPAYTLQD
ncbi:MAG: hypothetical protein LC808_11705, partial [Actinobacteria bacterium]|nr:hypothetical protein [Actinomycetota bacterium]